MRLILLAVALVLTGPPVYAAEAGILAKSGGDYDLRRKDQERCREIVSEARTDELPGMDPVTVASGAQGGMYAVAGAAIVGLVMIAVEIDRARGRGEAFCLNNLGYTLAPLTPDEARTYGGLTGLAREAYERAFLAKDIAPRLRAGLEPKTPPLPPYRPLSATFGGLRIELASLTAATGPISAGAIAATGRMDRWRTAVLTAPFKSTTGQIRVSAEPGVVFHQVDYRTQRAQLLRTQAATWCGPVRQSQTTSTGGPADNGVEEIYCFTSQLDGYDVFRPSGFAWLAGPYRTGFVLPRLTDPILLQERDRDDLGGIDLEIQVAEIRSASVTLEGKALHAGRKVSLWRRQLKFDESGQAVLPLWSRRMLIHRTDARQVVVNLDDAGDGQGWREDR